ncbi:hypothetical protein HYALB_00004217 [Hymenoscyphus albidus]|uniref:Heme haloperoxidase family profile domain-containing protein n=1 Tax=Hymenoscyphus albidus TaxID=595503 RepID=A0A9N9M502_9HELO|nr:hypothetical protein HYALB_00004217 [Hymenoscyphus albidus]
MKLVLVSVIAALGSTIVADSLPYDIDSDWAPAGPGDVRGPCPMLNTLANHNILPHNGKNLTEEITIQALIDGVNFTSSLGKFLFNFALTTNPVSGTGMFDLDHLGIHNILEHDASLSRPDDFHNPSDVFDPVIFNETKSYWTGEIIDLEAAATSRHARAETSVATNPGFMLSNIAMGFAYGEVAAYLMVFGKDEDGRKAGQARKDWVTYLFEQEKLPTELGWITPNPAISNLELCQMTQNVFRTTGTTKQVAEAWFPCFLFGAS